MHRNSLTRSYLYVNQDELKVIRHDAATCFMVSQFILDRNARADFFRAISQRLKDDGIRVSADLSAAAGSPEYEALLSVWVRMLQGIKASADAIEAVHSAWAIDVAILPPDEVEEMIKRSGFDLPVQFYQAGLIRAWFSRR